MSIFTLYLYVFIIYMHALIHTEKTLSLVAFTEWRFWRLAPRSHIHSFRYYTVLFFVFFFFLSSFLCLVSHLTALTQYTSSLVLQEKQKIEFPYKTDTLCHHLIGSRFFVCFFWIPVSCVCVFFPLHLYNQVSLVWLNRFYSHRKPTF